MHPGESLWQAGAGPQGVSSATFYNRFRGYLRLAGLPPSGVHVLRHTAAKLRRDVGESVESVSQFLDHSSLAVTTTYLRRLEGERDAAWHRRRNRYRRELALPACGGLRLTGLESCSGGVRKWVGPDSVFSRHGVGDLLHEPPEDTFSVVLATIKAPEPRKRYGETDNSVRSGCQ